MKTAGNFMLLMLMGFVMLLFTACGDEGSVDPVVDNQQIHDPDDDDNSDDDDDGDDGDDNNTSMANNYSGSASYGDLITFEVDKDALTYKLYNETTNQTESGTFEVISEAEVDGLYAIEASGEQFFAMELDDQIITANFPSGRSANDLSFGVSSEIDNSEFVNQIPGDYIYIRLGDVAINGSTDFKEFGVFTLTSDNEIFLIDYATGGTGDVPVVGVEDLASEVSFPITGDEGYFIEGQWSVSGSKSDRFDVTLGGTTATGYAYADGSTSVFLVDLGTGNGTAIAYKVSNPSLTSIAGNYKFIDTQSDNSKGAGAYNISSDGMVEYAYTQDLETIDEGTFGPITKVDLVTNVFVADFDGDYIAMVIAGDAIMHFITDDEGRLIAYGAGARL